MVWSGEGRRFRDADEVPGHGPDVDRPPERHEVVREGLGIVEYLHDAVLAAVIEPAQRRRGRLVREDFLVCRCGGAVVDEDCLAARREGGRDSVSEAGQPRRRDMGEPEGEEHGVVASWRLPVEQVGLEELNGGGCRPRTSEGQHFG